MQTQPHTTLPTSLYVHVPFCKSRCFYCDFNTYVAPTKVMDAYATALDVELQMLSKQATKPLKTIFFGGGTPTLPPLPILERMLESVRTHFTFATDCEWTFESNPDSIDQEKLRLLSQYGVNRISFGAQTFQDRLLMTIGRSHDAERVITAVKQATSAGFRHINVDLMFGLPEQSLDDVAQALDQVLDLPVDHVSAYWLKVESGTPFARWRDLGQLPLPGEDLEADMYHLVSDVLQKNGFHHYEISNFAKQGGDAKHNLVYWRNQPYFAAGAGAHGYVHGERYENVRKLPTYIETLESGKRPISEMFQISDREAAEDSMMLGLRLSEGVSQREFLSRHGVVIESLYGDIIDDLLAKKHLELRDGRYLIPYKLWPVANEIFEKFVSLDSVD